MIKMVVAVAMVVVAVAAAVVIMVICVARRPAGGLPGEGMARGSAKRKAVVMMDLCSDSEAEDNQRTSVSSTANGAADATA